MGREPLLEFSNVSKSYGSISAVSGVSLRIFPGEMVAILGCNGAGKSTLLNLASGLRRVDQGQVRVLGQDPREQSIKAVARILPQELSFPATLTVREILETTYAHYPGADYKELCAAIQLDALLERRASALSGGERRKLGIVCSLAGRPKLVLLDEPTANIDLIGQDLVHQALVSYFKGSESALIFSSHQMDEVEWLADRIVVLRSGRIVAEGPAQEIKRLLKQAKVIYTPSRDPSARLELAGLDSDVLLKQVIERDPGASGIEIVKPTLEEVIVGIWEAKAQV